jgi:hypothetical protein
MNKQKYVSCLKSDTTFHNRHFDMEYWQWGRAEVEDEGYLASNEYQPQSEDEDEA